MELVISIAVISAVLISIFWLIYKFSSENRIIDELKRLRLESKPLANRKD